MIVISHVIVYSRQVYYRSFLPVRHAQVLKPILVQPQLLDKMLATLEEEPLPPMEREEGAGICTFYQDTFVSKVVCGYHKYARCSILYLTLLMHVFTE